jgi:hypothetical protein
VADREEELPHVQDPPATAPIYHDKHDSIEAHLTIAFAALAVSRWLERQTGWSIKKLVKTLRRYRSIAVKPATTSSTPAHPSTTPHAPPSTPSGPPALDTSLSQVGSATS